MYDIKYIKIDYYHCYYLNLIQCVQSFHEYLSPVSASATSEVSPQALFYCIATFGWYGRNLLSVSSNFMHCSAFAVIYIWKSVHSLMLHTRMAGDFFSFNLIAWKCVFQFFCCFSLSLPRCVQRTIAVYDFRCWRRFKHIYTYKKKLSGKKVLSDVMINTVCSVLLVYIYAAFFIHLYNEI